MLPPCSIYTRVVPDLSIIVRFGFLDKFKLAERKIFSEYGKGNPGLSYFLRFRTKNKSSKSSSDLEVSEESLRLHPFLQLKAYSEQKLELSLA